MYLKEFVRVTSYHDGDDGDNATYDIGILGFLHQEVAPLQGLADVDR